MDMTGERRLPAGRARVWAALNDPEVLRASIPGCRSLDPTGEDGYRATATVKIGPISANFSGEVRLLDRMPPASYRIEGSGQGGAAGFARGSAAVALDEDGAGTVLRYRVKAEVGGKIAQLGARLIDASAKQMADQFFDHFVSAMAPPETEAAPGQASAPSAVTAMKVELLGFPLIAWIAAAVFLFIACHLLGAFL